MNDTPASRSGLVFAERETGPLLLDIVLPPAATTRVPVVLWLHGGGWFTGDRTMAPNLPRHFAARGMAMASIDYRLSGQAPHPAQLHDVRAAIRYLRREAGWCGIDPNAIGLWGSSAGGHLAALAGVTGHLAALPGEPDADRGPHARVQAVSEGYGPVDLGLVIAEGEQLNPNLTVDDSPEARLLGGSPHRLTEQARSASPLTYVTIEAPPFLIAHGTADGLVPPTQSVLLHEALAAAGAESTLYLVDGFRHGFLNPAGTVELDGPKLMDDGRLDTEGEAAATRDARIPGAPAASARTTLSFARIVEFFAHHLQQGAVDDN